MEKPNHKIATMAL